MKAKADSASPLKKKPRPKRKFVRSGKFFVYILECRDKTYYTGFTPDIKRRLALHNCGKGAKYTKDRRPVRLIWKKMHRYFKPAFLMERRIKDLTRKQKELLVRGRIIMLASGKLRKT